MSKKFLILIFFFLFHAFVFSQNCQCDSYKAIVEQISKLNKDKKVAEIYNFVNEIEKKGNKKCAAVAANEAAAKLYYLQEFSESLKMLQRIGTLLNESCLDTVRAYNYYLIGRCYFGLSSMDSSQVYYIKCAELAEKIKAYEIQVNALSDISWNFQSFGQTAKGMDYLKKALAISIKIKDNREIGILYSNIASAYGEMYEASKNEKYLDSSLSALNNGLKLHRIEKNEQSIQYIYVTYANVYLAKKDYKKALSYCDSATTMPEVESYNKYIIYSVKSNVYKNTGNKNLALKYADSCYQVALAVAPPYQIEITMNELIQCYKDMGNVEMALAMTEKMIKLKDSTKTIEVNAHVNELEQKYNKAQNEKTILELNQEKEILSQQEEISQLKINALIIGVLFLALLVFVIVFFYRQSILKSKFKTLEIEQRLNRARINPHFFFNALASLQALSMEEKKSKEISEYIHRFSKIMRESLESTFNELNTIENEIEFLTHYLELQKLRSDNKFTYQFEVDEKIETDALMIPGMILQPFIENSIEHGFSSIETGGKINVSFKIENNQLKVNVIDNGSGFKESDKHKGYPSRATQIIRDRLYLLNKQYKTNAIFELTNTADKGTKVEIQLPIIPKS